MKDSIIILCGGGPAPGMNTVVMSVAKTFLSKGYRVIGLHGGYSGLFSQCPRTEEIDFFKLRLTRSTSTLPTTGPPSSDHDPSGRSQPNLLYTLSFLLLVYNPTTDFEHLGSGIKSPTDPD